MCRYLQCLAYQSGIFLQSSCYMGLSTMLLATSISSTYRPLAARKLTRCRFGEPSRNSSCVAALADCWRLRFDSSRRPRAPRTWIHLNRIYKKQLEEKNGTGGPNRYTGGGRIDFSITRSCSRIASTASCDLRLWPIEK